jgi:hypothetical protein
VEECSNSVKANVRSEDEGCGNGEEEREGCCFKGATVSDYIHKRAE